MVPMHLTDLRKKMGMTQAPNLGYAIGGAKGKQNSS